MAIKFALHYATHDASEAPRWFAEYYDDQGVIDDSEKSWHPSMPDDPDAEEQARAIAETYAAKLQLAAGLYAECNRDGWHVIDPSGGVWWPNPDAEAEIVNAPHAASRAVAIARDQPMRGQWHC